MDSIYWESDRALLIPICLCLLGVSVVFHIINDSKCLPKAPRWGEHLGNKGRQAALLTDAKAVYSKNYYKFKDALGWFVPVPGDTLEKLVISPRYIAELKRLPQSVLSFEKAFSNAKDQKYTNSPPPNFFQITPRIIKSKLTPAIARLAPTLSADSQQAVLTELGPCNDWTPVKVHEKIMHIIAVLSGRVFIGPELCRDKRYIDAAINYTNDFSRALRDLEALNAWTRLLFANRLPSVKALRRRENEFISLLSPVVQARATAEKQNDMLAWLMDEAASSGIDGITHIARIQLALFAVAFHTTALTATNALFDLAASPEYIDPLRQEIQQTLSENNGVFTNTALHSLAKLDSFIKESIRLRPMSVATFQRRVLKEFTLSDGTVIPRGTIIEIANDAIAHDPEFFEDPETFRPWRFVQENSTNPGQGQGQGRFASVAGVLGTFGFGPHACPGRFFAAAEIKMVIAWMLERYEVKMPQVQGRYKNLEFGLVVSPDTEREILFKMRE